MHIILNVYHNAWFCRKSRKTARKSSDGALSRILHSYIYDFLWFWLHTRFFVIIFEHISKTRMTHQTLCNRPHVTREWCKFMLCIRSILNSYLIVKTFCRCVLSLKSNGDHEFLSIEYYWYNFIIIYNPELLNSWFYLPHKNYISILNVTRLCLLYTSKKS